EASRLVEIKLNCIIEDLIRKGCRFCSSRLTWNSRKILQVRCTWKPCGKLYYLYESLLLTNDFNTNLKILLVSKFWLSGSNILEIEKWLEISRYRIYKFLKKGEKMNINKKYL
ncbi:hypothetical protein DMUE_4826, partial [Dictyocoela muelleri]